VANLDDAQGVLTGMVVTPASIVNRLAKASSVSPGLKNALTSATMK